MRPDGMTHRSHSIAVADIGVSARLESGYAREGMQVRVLPPALNGWATGISDPVAQQ